MGAEVEVAFHAQLYGGRTDRDGEWRVTFTVPASELPSLLRLMTWTEKLLLVKVKESPPV